MMPFLQKGKSAKYETLVKEVLESTTGCRREFISEYLDKHINEECSDGNIDDIANTTLDICLEVLTNIKDISRLSLDKNTPESHIIKIDLSHNEITNFRTIEFKYFISSKILNMIEEHQGRWKIGYNMIIGAQMISDNNFVHMAVKGKLQKE
jgi:hypothetical protein